MASECAICCSDYTKVVRKEIKCLYCGFGSCTECTKKYLLDSTKDPHCMSCGVGWNKEFVFQCFSKAFFNKDLKEKRERDLLEREKSMLPASIAYAEEEKRKRNIQKEIDAIELQKTELYKQLGVLNDHIFRKRNEMYGGGGKAVEKEKRVFVRACPSTGCKGFLSTQWKCGLCNVWVCPDCHEIKGNAKDADHTCDPDILKTAQLLDADTKPCPTCASLIFKISGCDQMWCTSCQTTFSWKTGQIEKGVVHNPHYYEYMRKNGTMPRNIGDVPCGGLPWATQFGADLRAKGLVMTSETANCLIDFLRLLHHVQQVEMHRYPVRNRGVQDNLDLRVRYLLNELEEDDWKRELQKRDRMHDKNAAHRLIFDMVVAVGVDLVNRALQCKSTKELDVVAVECHKVRDHANDGFMELARMYNRTVATHIVPKWYMDSVPVVKTTRKRTTVDNSDAESVASSSTGPSTSAGPKKVVKKKAAA